MSARRFFCIVTLLTTLGYSPVYGQGVVDLPDMGNSAAGALGVEEEQRLGREVLRQVRRSLKRVRDPEVEDYLQHLGYRLVEETRGPLREYTFFAIDDPSLNAFAAPGGFVAVHTGLILNTRSVDELAAVVAHEIAHITQQHLARAMESSQRLSVPITAAMIAGMILSGTNPELGQAAVAAAVAGGEQAQLGFSRAHEQEADRVGIETLARAGYDARAMASFFERLQQATRLNESALPEFLRTHPVTTSRISDARGRAEQLANVGTRDDTQYLLVRAKLRVMASANPQELIKTLSASPGDRRSPDLRYTQALALYTVGRHDEARRVLKALLEKDANNTFFQIALARVEFAAGRVPEGLRILREGLKLAPDHRALTLVYAQGLLDNGQVTEAKQLLQPQLQRDREDPDRYELLARAENVAGNTADAHIAQAESYYLNGQTREAIKQLDLAARAIASDDSYRKARIQTRRAEIDEVLKMESKH